jgi:excisionase family DNA binding protein
MQAFAKKEFLTVSEYAKKSRVSEITVRRLIRSSKLLAIRVGRQWRIPSCPPSSPHPSEIPPALLPLLVSLKVACDGVQEALKHILPEPIVNQ